MSEPPSPIGRPPAKVIVLMAAARTMAVATIYYNQPLTSSLNQTSSRFAMSHLALLSAAGGAQQSPARHHIDCQPKA
jgi:hypothetical protein